MALALVFAVLTLLAFVLGALSGYNVGYEDAQREARKAASRISAYLKDLEEET